MKALIPTAGQGTRLYPQTHTKPKAMVRLAGRPILGHILDSIADPSIDEVIVVVGGLMQEQIVDYADGTFGERFEFAFVEQERALGLSHGLYQAVGAIDGEPVLIALDNRFFEDGYAQFLEAHDGSDAIDGSLDVKQVEGQQFYSIVELDLDGRIVRLVEKPALTPRQKWPLSRGSPSGALTNSQLIRSPRR